MNLAGAMTWLKNKSFANEGIAATYVSGATRTALTAIRGRAQWESDGSDGSLVRMESPDYLVRAADIAGVPSAGDRIIDGESVFEVMSPNQQNPWQWADWPNKTVYRIHTKQVDTEIA